MAEELDLLQDIKRRFKAACDAETENRELALEDARFENGEQWDERSLADREDRPNLVINKVQAVVKQIVGDARQNMPRVKVRPIDDKSDVQVSELFNGMIRNINNGSDAEQAIDYGFECAIRQAWGYWRINTKYADDDTFEQDISIERIENPFSIYCDNASRKPNRIDAKWWFATELLTKEEFEAQYPGANLTSFDAGRGDTDIINYWADDGAIRVAEYWYKEPYERTLCLLKDGRTVDKDDLDAEERELLKPFIVRERKVDSHKIFWCKTNGAEILKKPVEWAGKYFPFVECPGEELFIEGRRILRSAVRFAKDPQRLYNWARSTAVETMALAPKQPWLTTPEAIEGHERQWQDAHRKPMPYLLYNNGEAPPQRQMGAIPDSGAYQESLAAADDIKATTGIYDASLGARSNETSGVAIMARQREGDAATYIFHDNLKRAVQYTGKILVDLIPKIYDTQRVVRLLNDDGSEAWQEVNVLHPITGEVMANDITKGKFDVVADVGPAYMTKRIEAANSMLQFMQMFPPSAPVVGPRLATNMDWPEAPEIAQELRQLMQPPPPPQPTPMEMLEFQNKQMNLKKDELDIQGKQLLNTQRQMNIQEELNQKARDDMARAIIVKGGING